MGMSIQTVAPGVVRATISLSASKKDSDHVSPSKPAQTHPALQPSTPAATHAFSESDADGRRDIYHTRFDVIEATKNDGL
jgi:hypothetical protein